MNITVGGWFGYAAIVIVIALLIWFSFCFINETSESTAAKSAVLIVAFALSVGILIGMNWYYSNTESGKRAVKTQESNFNEGIKRSVHVYDMNGGLIKEYEGKFDVDYDNDRVIFDDEKGMRHIIYYPTGTIIIDEIP